MQTRILIIGGSSGLGRALAGLYAKEGCIVGIIGRREELLQEVQQQFPSLIHFLKADISQPAIADKLLPLIKSMGGMDKLIITASIVEFNDKLDPAIERDTVHTNVNGFTELVNMAWHYFRAQQSGHIIGVSSVAAARGNKRVPAYHASKAFQSIYLESLRVKSLYEKNGVHITELVPGYMATAMGKGDRLFWMVPLDKAARQSKKAIDKKKRRAFISKRWWLIYQLYRFLPSFIYNRLVNSGIRSKQTNTALEESNRH